VEARDLPLEMLCGQLIVGTFEGTSLPASWAAELAAGRRAGAILFRGNVGDVRQVAALTRAIGAAAQVDLPPFVAVDQEGGRVRRLREPFLDPGPMRGLGAKDDLELTAAIGAQMGRELRAMGFNLDFAPVVDVDSNPDNPVIGDRSFGGDPRTVMRHAVAFLRGLQGAEVLACAKHFPGHGDTAVDSHLDLPLVAEPAERLRQIELPPFRAASGAGVASMMTAHVVYAALDAGVPATFSRAICSELLRGEIGFDGVLFSDDLTMGAVTKRHGVDDAAVLAIDAGCDVVLVCHDGEGEARAHAALVRRAGADSRFRARCIEAAERSLRIRRLCPPSAASDDGIARVVGTPAARDLAARIIGGVA
jgi:beta-N-acetylhexosaminidase